ncbi:hypothetical protein EDD15DRAFT_2377139 [Pisolithus albus]|nr:hypothetical protein EDD15DRAFT_2377139 [Pisolithus albus]
MSHPPQRRVRFYRQVDVLPIENRDESGASSGPIVSSSTHTRATVRENKSMEALQAYGEDSPSPPSEPVTVGDQYARLRGDKVPSPPVEPNQEPQADLFERMKVAEVPEPPTSHGKSSFNCGPDTQDDVEAEPCCDPSERMTPAIIRRSPTPAASQPDLFERMRNATIPPAPSPYNDVSGPNEDIAGPSPGPASQSDLFERMRNATVPPAPREQNEDSASPSPPPASQSDLFERMRKAKVPPAPSPYMDVSDHNDDTASRSPGPASQSDLYERMRNATVPPPPCPDIEDEDNVESDLFRRLRAARIPPPPDVHAVEISEQMEDVRASSPAPASGSELFERMRRAVVPPAPIDPGQEEHHADYGRQIDFGDPQRGHIRQSLADFSTWNLPTLDEVADMERTGLASRGLSDDVLRVLAMFKSRHASDTAPSTFPRNEQLDRPILQAMKRIASEIREGANLRMLRLKECEYTLEIIDMLEVVRHPHTAYNLQPYSRGPDHPSRQALIEMAIVYMGCRIECAAIHLLEREDVSEWPAEWFSNISSDLRELDHLVLISVCRRSPFPPLPACYHAYLRWKDVEDEFQNELRRIPKESFQLLDNLGSFIPNWTPRFPDKYGGFAFPWWLHGASRYSVDFEELRGAKVFQTAAEYFQHEWPLNETSFSDRLDSLLEDRVAQYMTNLVYISNIIERIDGEMNHLFSRWFALQKLVGTPNVS